MLRLAAAMGPSEHRSRFALPGHVIPPAVRSFYREVSGYLHGTPGMADDMRARVRAAIDRNDGPLVLVAHSLGSIIAFDVLGEPALAGREVSFLTVGSPLGLGPAQDHLRSWRGSRPIEIPSDVALWRNFQAAGDPVAVGAGLEDLRSDCAPSLRVPASEVRNEAEWHHAFSGHLETPEVRDAIYARLSERPRPTTG
jgi:pimeloyl-ACP methyl ester carboxylesterase